MSSSPRALSAYSSTIAVLELRSADSHPILVQPPAQDVNIRMTSATRRRSATSCVNEAMAGMADATTKRAVATTRPQVAVSRASAIGGATSASLMVRATLGSDNQFVRSSARWTAHNAAPTSPSRPPACSRQGRLVPLPPGMRSCVRDAGVTSQGSAYARLRRATDTRNAQLAWVAAVELEHIERPGRPRARAVRRRGSSSSLRFHALR